MFLQIANLLPSVMWVAVSGLLLTVGDVVFRFYLDGYRVPLATLAFFVYGVGIFAMTMSFHHQNIAVATLAAILINILTITLVSVWYFGDSIETIQWVGLTLGLIALILLELAG